MDRNRVVAYIICGVGSGLAAMILIAKLASGEPTAGNGYELECNCRGMYWWNKWWRYNGGNCDRCNLILGIKKVGLITSKLDTFWQYVATGVVIIIAAYVEIIQSKLAKRSK